MMLTTKASTRRPAPTSFAKPSHSVGSSPIAPARTAGESVLDVDMRGPPVESGRRRRTAARGGQQQQAREADRGGAEAGREQRCPRAEGAHDEAAEGERTDLGAVAGAVVPGERAAAQGVRHALADERAEEDVLDAVGDAADGEAEQRHAQDRRHGSAREAEALRDDRRRGSRGHTRRRHAVGDAGGARRHAEGGGPPRAPPAAMPRVQAVMSRPYPRRPAPRTSVTKNVSAVADIVKIV